MKARLLNQGDDVAFDIYEVEPHLHAAVRQLAFQPTNDGFAQEYPAGYPRIEQIFANFERHVEELVRQRARELPVPWDSALLAYCDAVRGHGIDWWLTGSAALAVRGLPVNPHDLDLAVDEASAAKVEQVMLDYLIEPPRPGFISAFFVRSFPGACVEWCVGVDERADRHLAGDVGPTAARRLETVTWRSREIRVPPLELQLVVNKVRGYSDRVRLIERAIANQEQSSQ